MRPVLDLQLAQRRFKGTAFREWDASGSTFSFQWKTETGDQIGRIGVSYGSNRLGVRMGDLRPD